MLWDYRVYQEALCAYINGGDPYQVSVNGLRYVYPPNALPLLLPAALPWWLYLACTATAAGALCWLWWRYWGVSWWEIVLVAGIGLNYAGWVALSSGNAVVFEQLLLWGGLTCWLRHRESEGMGLIVLAGSFKLWPLVLLPILFGRRGLVVLAIAAACYGVCLYITGWGDNLAWLQRQSGGAMAYSLRGVLGGSFWAAVALTAIVLLATSALAPTMEREHQACVWVAAVLATMPAVAPYTLLALVVPAIWATRLVPGRAAGMVLVCLGVCGMAADHAPPFEVQRWAMWAWPWLISWGVWLMVLMRAPLYRPDGRWRISVPRNVPRVDNYYRPL